MGDRTESKRHSWWSYGGLAMVATLASCSTPRTRPVVDTRPFVVSVERTVWSTTEDQALRRSGPSPEEVHDRERCRQSLCAWAEAAARSTIAVEHMGGQTGLTSFAEPLLGNGPAQLDAGLGPVDLGFPLLIDLGAGDAPYDDGIPTIHGVESKRGGFSDSIVQMMWRETLSPMTSVHTGAAIRRYQDLSILDGLEDARFAWAVIGLQWRF